MLLLLLLHKWLLYQCPVITGTSVYNSVQKGQRETVFIKYVDWDQNSV